MKKMGKLINRFPYPLITEHLKKRQFKLKELFVYIVSVTPPVKVLVPAGFITDLASIPRPFWSIIGSPNGRYGKAAVIHDYLYHVQVYTRGRTDRIFLEAMKVLKVNWLRRRAMWIAVRAGGWIPWNRHKKNLGKEVKK